MPLANPSVQLLFCLLNNNSPDPRRSATLTLSISLTLLCYKRLHFSNEPEQHAALIASNPSSIARHSTLICSDCASTNSWPADAPEDEHQAAANSQRMFVMVWYGCMYTHILCMYIYI